MSVYFSTFSHSTLNCTFVNFAENSGKESFFGKETPCEKARFCENYKWLLLFVIASDKCKNNPRLVNFYVACKRKADSKPDSASRLSI